LALAGVGAPGASSSPFVSIDGVISIKSRLPQLRMMVQFVPLYSTVSPTLRDTVSAGSRLHGLLSEWPGGYPSFSHHCSVIAEKVQLSPVQSVLRTLKFKDDNAPGLGGAISIQSGLPGSGIAPRVLRVWIAAVADDGPIYTIVFYSISNIEAITGAVCLLNFLYCSKSGFLLLYGYRFGTVFKLPVCLEATTFALFFVAPFGREACVQCTGGGGERRRGSTRTIVITVKHTTR
jgi:hypothetical protein